jgi:hypothetical protein
MSTECVIIVPESGGKAFCKTHQCPADIFAAVSDFAPVGENTQQEPIYWCQEATRLRRNFR